MIRVKQALKGSGTWMIGPNCPGIATPGVGKVGFMPNFIHQKGNVGVISRSGTLTYEMIWQLTELGIGQSTSIGIGGDPIVGVGFIDLLELYEKDPETEAIVMIGEIGGTAEEEAAEFIRGNVTKPVVSFIAGRTAAGRSTSRTRSPARRGRSAPPACSWARAVRHSPCCRSPASPKPTALPASR
jgi:succinyl-CoA synthetase alpha subunit